MNDLILMQKTWVSIERFAWVDNAPSSTGCGSNRTKVKNAVGILAVSCCEPAEVLELIDAAVNQVSKGVDSTVRTALSFALSTQRNGGTRLYGDHVFQDCRSTGVFLATNTLGSAPGSTMCHSCSL